MTRVPARRALAVPLGIVLVIAGWLQSKGLAPGALAQAGTAFVLVWLGCLLLLWFTHKDGFYRPAATYLLVLGIFHGGLLISVLLGGGDSELVQFALPWLTSELLPASVHLVLVGMSCFTGVVLVTGAFRLLARAGHADPPATERATMLAVVGILVQCAGVALSLRGLLAGGVSVFSAGYASVYSTNSGATLAYGVLLTSTGAAFGVIAGGRARVFAWALFVLFSLAAFPLGLRSAVLFPALTLLVIDSRMGRRPPTWLVSAGAALVLVLVPIVRQTRTDGIGAILSSKGALAPLDAVSEMGYSLYPSVVVQQWHQSGEPYAHGVTFAAVPLRLLERLTGHPPPDPDFRLFNVEVHNRIGEIGGSPIAEGFHNGGLVGVILLMAALGLVIGASESMRRGQFQTAVLAVVFLPIFLTTRNAMSVVLPQMAVGAVLLAVGMLPRPQRSRARFRARAVGPPLSVRA